MSSPQKTVQFGDRWTDQTGSRWTVTLNTVTGELAAHNHETNERQVLAQLPKGDAGVDIASNNLTGWQSVEWEPNSLGWAKVAVTTGVPDMPTFYAGDAVSGTVQHVSERGQKRVVGDPRVEYSWGYHGAGCRALAAVMLEDLVGPWANSSYVTIFTDEILSQLTWPEDMVLITSDLHEWLEHRYPLAAQLADKLIWAEQRAQTAREELATAEQVLQETIEEVAALTSKKRAG